MCIHSLNIKFIKDFNFLFLINRFFNDVVIRIKKILSSKKIINKCRFVYNNLYFLYNKKKNFIENKPVFIYIF